MSGTILAGYILMVLGMFWALNIAYRRTKHFDRQFSHVKKFKNVPVGLELINLGSNHALYGFAYGRTGLQAFNFAVGPQFLLYDFLLLKAYTRNLRSGCVVIITIAPCVFFCDGAGCDDERYYMILPRATIPRFSWVKQISKITLPLLSHPTAVRFLISDIEEVPHPAMSAELCEKEAVARSNGWAKQFALQNMISTDFPTETVKEFQKTTSILSNMIEFCKYHDFQPVIVIPPVSRKLRDHLGKEFLQIALYDNICKANSSKVPVLGYLQDVRFENYTLYFNSDFLNPTGANYFTDIVIRDLRALGYLREDLQPS